MSMKIRWLISWCLVLSWGLGVGADNSRGTDGAVNVAASAPKRVIRVGFGKHTPSGQEIIKGNHKADLFEEDLFNVLQFDENVELVFVPITYDTARITDEAYKNLVDEKVDILAHVVANENNKKYLHLTTPIHNVALRLCLPASRDVATSFEDINHEHTTMAVRKNSYEADLLKRLHFRGKILETDDIITLLAALDNKKCNAAILPDTLLRQYETVLKMHEIIVALVPISSIGCTLGVRPEDLATLTKLESALARARVNGDLSRLCAKWFASSAAKIDLRFCVPYNFSINANRAVREIFRRVGINISITPLRADDALSDTNIGEYAGIACYSGRLVEKYPNILPTKIPYATLEFRASGNAVEKINSWADLLPYRVGFPHGQTSISSQLPDKTASLSPRRYWSEVCEDLLDGQIDFAVGAFLQGQTPYYLPAELAKQAKVLSSMPAGIFLHKNHLSLLPLLNDTVEQMTDDGSLAAILAGKPLNPVRKKEILFIHSYHSEFNWDKAITEGMSSVFHDKVAVYHYYLDSKRSGSSLEYWEEMAKRLFAVGLQNNFDLLMIADNPALDFVQHYYNLLLPNLPAVFCGINNYTPELVNDFPQFTGVSEDLSIAPTVKMMIALKPEMRNIFVINDNSLTGLRWRNEIQNTLSGLPEIASGKIKLSYHYNTAHRDLLAYVGTLNPQTTAILLGTYFADNTNAHFMGDTGVSEIANHSSVPIYALNTTFQQLGVVGGKMTAGFSQGKTAATMVESILTAPAKIDQHELRKVFPVISDGDTTNKWVFNEAAMRKWGFSKSKISEAVQKVEPLQFTENTLEFIGNETSLIAQYRWLLYPTIVGLIIIVLAMIIFFYRNNPFLLERKNILRSALIAGLLCLPVTVMSLYGQSIISEIITENLQNVATHAAHSADRLIQLRANDLLLIARYSQVNNPELPLDERIKFITDYAQRYYPEYLLLYDLNGNCAATEGGRNIIDQEALRKIMSSTEDFTINEIIDAGSDGQKKLSWYIGVALKNENNMVGALVAVYDHQQLDLLFNDFIKPNNINYVYVANKAGLIIAHTQKNFVGKGLNELATLHNNAQQCEPMIDDLANGVDGKCTYALDEQARLAVYVRLAHTPWMIVMVTLHHYAFAVLDDISLAFKIIIVGILMMVLVYATITQKLYATINVSSQEIIARNKSLLAQSTALEQSKNMLSDQVKSREAVLKQLQQRANNLLRYSPINEKIVWDYDDGTAASSPSKKKWATNNNKDETASLLFSRNDEHDIEIFTQRVYDIFDRLADRLSWYKSIIDSLIMPTIITDLEMDIMYLNHPQELLLSERAFTYLGKSCTAIHAEFATVIARLQRQEAQQPFYLEREKNWYISHCSWLYNAKEEPIGYIISNQNITQRVAAEAANQKTQASLDTERKLLSTIFSIIPDPLWYRDEQKKCVLANPRFLSLFHMDLADMVGKTVEEILPPHLRELQHHYDNTAIERRAPCTGEMEIDLGDHQEWYEVAITPLYHNGIFAGLLGLGRNINTYVAAAQQMDQARAAAENVAKMKSEFLANMSHEIRTPMNAILGFTQVALRDETNPLSLARLKKINLSTEILLSIINDILDFSKIEAGKIDLEHSPFNLVETLEKVIAMVEGRIGDKNVKLLLTIAPEVPQFYLGDAVRLWQVLKNLLDNAIKFTAVGQVELRITCSPKPAAIADTIMVEFAVSDSGIGMTEEQLSRIFKPFEQADTSTTRNFGGTGLGMTITNKLVSLMQGEIIVKSTVKVGTTFTVILPLTIDHAPVATRTEPATANHEEALLDFSSKKILLVEDNPINQEVAKALLEPLNLRIEIANNGAEAVKLVEENYYDLVLMDLQMPELDGYQATKIIRAMPAARFQAMPIIAMTAHALKDEHDRCMSIGMNDHITKPIEIDVLENTLKKWLRRT